MATAVAGLRGAYRLPAIAGGVTALAGTAIALVTLILTIIDRQSPPTYTLAGLDVDWSLGVRTAVQTVGLITMSVISGVIVWRRPRALLSVLFLVLAASLLLEAFASQYAIHGLLVMPGSLPLADLAAWSQRFVPDLGFAAGAGFLLLFPDGRPASPRWWLLLGLAIITLAADLLIGLDDPYPLPVGPMAWVWVPVTAPPALWPIGAWLGFASGVVSWGRQALAIAFAVYLLRRLAGARGEVRLQLKWFAYAASIYLVTSLLGLADNPPPLDWLPSQLHVSLQQFASSEIAHAVGSWASLLSRLAGLGLLPAAIGVAMLRYRLYDIDIVINRTIIYGGLALFVTGAYAVVVAGIGSLLGQRAGLNPLLTIVAIALVAALLLPVRSRLQALADTAVYGKRARPYDVLSDFASSISRAEPADVLLPRMANLLRDGTGSAGAEVWVKLGDHFHLAASSPQREAIQPILSTIEEVKARLGADAHSEAVYHDGAVLGALLLAKPRGEGLSSVERRLFHDLASQAGLVLVRFRLVQELRESRSRIVAAQDAERQRVERDLHDGAQQQLVALLLSMQSAKSEALKQGDRPVADLIDANIAALNQALDELRELARGIHPTILTQAGLLPAIQSLAERSPIPVEVKGDLGDTRLAPSLEAALYFVVAEAITNAVKHARAKRISVQVGRSPGLATIQVSDDGVGGADPSRGSGLLGLTDRVAAVGGRLAVNSDVRKGTTIHAEVPCGQ